MGEGRIRVEFDLTTVPPLRHQPLLLELAGALVEDAVKRSLDPLSTGRIFVALRRTGNAVELIVEDDGWRECSQTAWLADNQVVRRLTAIAGGSLRRDVDWASNQAVVSLLR